MKFQKKEPIKVTGLSIPESLADWMKAEAKKNGISFSNAVCQLIQQYKSEVEKS